MTNNKIVNLGDADVDSPKDAVNVDFSRFMTPVGAVLDYAGSTAPTNFYMCDGSSKAVSANSKLFSVIGYTYGGAGDYFNLPLCIGKVSLGAGVTYVTNITGGIEAYTYTLGVSGGSDRHKLTVDELAAHSHTIDLTNSVGAGNAIVAYGGVSDGTGGALGLVEGMTAGNNYYHNNMQPYIAFNKIIRYK
jgi:microcystin-dependent protein